MILPPGPRFPLLPLLAWITRPAEFLHTGVRRYGDPFTVRFGAIGTVVFFGRPDAVREIFRAGEAHLSAGAVNRPLLPLMGEHSLLLADGAAHREQRRCVAPFFNRGLEAHAEVMRRAVRKVAAGWRPGRRFLLHRAMQEISLEILARTSLTTADAAAVERFKASLDAVVETARASLVFFKLRHRERGRLSRSGQVLSSARRLDAIVDEELARRRQGASEAVDLLGHLASQTRAGRPLSAAEIRDQVRTMLISAHVTTPTSAAWAFYWVLRTPRVREKLLRELERLGPDPSPGDLAGLEYLDAVCLETLRRCPTIPVTARCVTRTIRLAGFDFEPGVYLAPSIYLVHHREDLYPEPRRFRPERFLERRFAAHEYLPFGGGERTCPGAAFGLLTMKIALATVLAEVGLELADARPNRPAHGRSGVSLVPSRGVPVIVTGRR